MLGSSNYSIRDCIYSWLVAVWIGLAANLQTAVVFLTSEEELAFLNGNQGELSPPVLRSYQQYIPAEKRREAEAAAKAEGSGERTAGWESGHPYRLCLGGRGAVSIRPRSEPKRKANELILSDSGIWMEPLIAAWRPGLYKRTTSAPLPAQGPVVKCTTSTGEEAAYSDRQDSCAEAGAV